MGHGHQPVFVLSWGLLVTEWITAELGAIQKENAFETVVMYKVVYVQQHVSVAVTGRLEFCRGSGLLETIAAGIRAVNPSWIKSNIGN